MWELVSVRGQTLGNRLHEDPGVCPSRILCRQSDRAQSSQLYHVHFGENGLKFLEQTLGWHWTTCRGARHPVWMEAGDPSSLLSS